MLDKQRPDRSLAMEHHHVLSHTHSRRHRTAIRCGLGALLALVVVPACTNTQDAQVDVSSAPATPSAQSTITQLTTGPPSTTAAEYPTTTLALGDPDDVSAGIRAAIEATRAEPWFVWTSEALPFGEPITVLFENGVATECSSDPAQAEYSLNKLLDTLGSVEEATIQANDARDPQSPKQVMAFYDIHIDEQGRLAATSWYTGHLASFTTFAYSPEEAPNLDCSTASTDTTA